MLAATWKVEIRRITVQGQHRKKLKTLPEK
jgi:hypothetical protein